MRLLNTNGRLPGGWRYNQLDANGQLLKRWERDFDPWSLFLAKVQRFRELNNLPRAEMELVEADVTEYLAREFGGDPKYFYSAPGQKKTSHSSPAHNPKSSLAKLADKGRSLLTGAAVLADWLGAGAKPVTQAEAQNRADICTGRVNGTPCPHNDDGFKPVESIAQLIHSWVEEKNKMTLTVVGEDNLKTCGLCWCHLPTKIWTPMGTIIERTPKAMFDKFTEQAPENCWMKPKQSYPEP